MKYICDFLQPGRHMVNILSTAIYGLVSLSAVAMIVVYTISLPIPTSAHATDFLSENPRAEYEQNIPPLLLPSPTPLMVVRVSSAMQADLLPSCISEGDGIKVAYLTFDDGPTPNTAPILDILAKHHIRATFFCVGSQVKLYPEITKRAYAEGHLIANHSFSHRYGNVYASTKSFLYELQACEDTLAEVIGRENIVKLFRFPGGSFEQKKAHFRQLLPTTDYAYLDWNAVNSDSDGKPASQDRVIESLVSTCSAKEDVVVLMHDTMAHMYTVETLDYCIEYLKNVGFVFGVIIP